MLVFTLGYAPDPAGYMLFVPCEHSKNLRISIVLLIINKILLLSFHLSHLNIINNFFDRNECILTIDNKISFTKQINHLYLNSIDKP